MKNIYTTNNPKCNYHRDCFANIDGHCECLTDTKFCGKDCPFYKTKAQVDLGKNCRGNIYQEEKVCANTVKTPLTKYQ